MQKNKPGIDGRSETKRFSTITFDDYGNRALDDTLSENEKLGFPEQFRQGFDDTLWDDIVAKLPALTLRNKVILDIGCGCGSIPKKLISNAIANAQSLVLNDHANMLKLLPDQQHFTSVAGRFPDVLQTIATAHPEGFDCIVSYSVLHMVAYERNPFIFVDSALDLLKPGGRLLLGDIPNFSKLRRFLNSADGRAYHKNYMKTEADPVVDAFAYDRERLDDGFIMGLLTHIRISGFDAYLLPQDSRLPMATRREDLLVMRP